MKTAPGLVGMLGDNHMDMEHKGIQEMRKRLGVPRLQCFVNYH